MRRKNYSGLKRARGTPEAIVYGRDILADRERAVLGMVRALGKPRTVDVIAFAGDYRAGMILAPLGPCMVRGALDRLAARRAVRRIVRPGCRDYLWEAA